MTYILSIKAEDHGLVRKSRYCRVSRFGILNVVVVKCLSTFVINVQP